MAISTPEWGAGHAQGRKASPKGSLTHDSWLMTHGSEPVAPTRHWNSDQAHKPCAAMLAATQQPVQHTYTGGFDGNRASVGVLHHAVPLCCVAGAGRVDVFDVVVLVVRAGTRLTHENYALVW